jgi:hypothetical protein
VGHISASRFDQSRRRALVLASPCSTYLTLEGAWGRGRQGIDLLSPWGGGVSSSVIRKMPTRDLDLGRVSSGPRPCEPAAHIGPSFFNVTYISIYDKFRLGARPSTVRQELLVAGRDQ